MSVMFRSSPKFTAGPTVSAIADLRAALDRIEPAAIAAADERAMLHVLRDLETAIAATGRIIGSERKTHIANRRN